jgi:hypothetical protein
MDGHDSRRDNSLSSSSKDKVEIKLSPKLAMKVNVSRLRSTSISAPASDTSTALHLRSSSISDIMSVSSLNLGELHLDTSRSLDLESMIIPSLAHAQSNQSQRSKHLKSHIPHSPIQISSFPKTARSVGGKSASSQPSRCMFTQKAALDQKSPLIMPPPSPSPSKSYSLSSPSDITSNEITTNASKDTAASLYASEKPWYMLSFDELVAGKYESLMARPKPLTIEEVNWRCKQLVEQIQCLDDATVAKEKDITHHRQRIKLMIRLNNSLDTELNGFKQCSQLYNVIAEKELRQKDYRHTIERSMERRIKNYYDNRERQEQLAQQIEHIPTSSFQLLGT